MEIWQCNDERARPCINFIERSRLIFMLAVTCFSFSRATCQVRNGSAMGVRLSKMWESNASDNKATNVESAHVFE